MIRQIAFLAIFCCSQALPAIESMPLQIKAVHPDGAIEVSDGLHSYRVSPRWVRLPEPYMPEKILTTDAIRTAIPVTSWVRLWGPKGSWEFDKQGNLRALILLGPSGDATLQKILVESGNATFWIKDDVQPPGVVQQDLVQAARAARAAKRGMWGTVPGWAQRYTDKSVAPRYEDRLEFRRRRNAW